ncbi:hypothetical protein CHELA20_50243 [Hyphomicrobiales bacterium]|nr:hypothetical protein CHELA41_20129 [Hyphomicrobiales bacterium]CAH1667687.1 hypothetical protein CHELA20_50243 [Hyphomicrobiales bacterium]
MAPTGSEGAKPHGADMIVEPFIGVASCTERQEQWQAGGLRIGLPLGHDIDRIIEADDILPASVHDDQGETLLQPTAKHATAKHATAQHATAQRLEDKSPMPGHVGACAASLVRRRALKGRHRRLRLFGLLGPAALLGLLGGLGLLGRLGLSDLFGHSRPGFRLHCAVVAGSAFPMGWDAWHYLTPSA